MEEWPNRGDRSLGIDICTKARRGQKESTVQFNEYQFGTIILNNFFGVSIVALGAVPIISPSFAFSGHLSWTWMHQLVGFCQPMTNR